MLGFIEKMQFGGKSSAADKDEAAENSKATGGKELKEEVADVDSWRSAVSQVAVLNLFHFGVHC